MTNPIDRIEGAEAGSREKFGGVEHQMLPDESTERWAIRAPGFLGYDGKRVVVVEYIPPPSSRTPESWRTVPGRWEFRPTHWTAIAPPSPAPDKEG